MESALAIIISLIVLVGGCSIFLLVLGSLEKRFLLFYLSSGAFLMISLVTSALCVTATIKGVWLLPGILFIVVSVMIGNLLFNIAEEERFLHRHKRLRAPVTAEEVSRGINWKELERWMLQNDR